MMIWSAATRLESALKLTRPVPPTARRGNRASKNLFHRPMTGPEPGQSAVVEFMGVGHTDSSTEEEEAHRSRDVVLVWMAVLLVCELKRSSAF